MPNRHPPPSACRWPRSTRRRSSSISTPSSAICSAWPTSCARPACACARTPRRTSRPIIAARQIALGAVGVCCQKVSEAEVMVAGGVGDVLVSNEVAGAAQARPPGRAGAPRQDRRVRRRCRQRRRDRGGGGARRAPGSTCWWRSTSAAGAAAWLRASRRRGSRSASRARRICALPACRPITARPSTCARRRERKRAHRPRGGAREGDAAGAEGRRAWRPPPSPAPAPAPTRTRRRARVYNELQAGSYIFMDADYARNKRADGGAVRHLRARAVRLRHGR